MSETGRCEICDWPLKERTEDGCVEGNCSYRPPEHSPEWYRIQKRRQELKTKQEKEFWDGEIAFVESRNSVAPKPQEERSETESDWKPMIEAIEGDGFFVVRHISSGIVANKINEHAALDALLNMLRRVEEFKQKHVVRSAALHESTMSAICNCDLLPNEHEVCEHPVRGEQ